MLLMISVSARMRGGRQGDGEMGGGGAGERDIK